MLSNNELFDVAEERKRRTLLATRREQRKQPNRCTAIGILAQRITPEAMSSKPDEMLSALSDLQTLVRQQFGSLTATAHTHWRQSATAYFGTERTFSIAYIDPPWRYNARANATSTAPHYSSMSDEELIRMPVCGLLNEDAVIALWATAPKFDVAIRLLDAWGFEFRTVLLTWIKVTAAGQTPVYSSTGAYSRPCAEYLLLGVRGRMQVSRRNGYLIDSVLETRRTEHSHKPDCVRNLLVTVFGDRTRIELFARETVPGWIVWGNETKKFNDLYAPANNGGGGDDEEFDNSQRRVLIRPGRTRVNNLSSIPTRSKKGRGIAADRQDRGTESKSDYYNKPCDGTKMTKSDFSVLGVDCKRARLYNHVHDLRAFFGDSTVTLRERRHTTYPSLSVREAEAREAIILRAQEHNDEMLFAMNNNTSARGKRFVLYTDAEMADAFEATTQSQVDERIAKAAAAPKRKGKRKALDELLRIETDEQTVTTNGETDDADVANGGLIEVANS